MNRLESTIANLSNVSENISASRSRIIDADIAQETSSMTKNNILQQAGVSVLAQANQTPQLGPEPAPVSKPQPDKGGRPLVRICIASPTSTTLPWREQ